MTADSSRRKTSMSESYRNRERLRELLMKDGTFEKCEITPPEEERITRIGFAGIIAGTFDFLGLDKVIDRLSGNPDPDTGISAGAVIRALVIQLLQTPYQTLCGTGEFFSGTPVSALLGIPVTGDVLSRELLERCLDGIAAADPWKLYVNCAGAACRALGVPIREIRLDCTEFSCDLMPDPESTVELRMVSGGGRDHHGEQQQLSLLGLTDGGGRDHHGEQQKLSLLGLIDGASRIPVHMRALEGERPDHRSFLELVGRDWPLLSEQFADLRYVAGEALCTPEILQAVADSGIQVITRVPDRLSIARDLIRETADEDLEPIPGECSREEGEPEDQKDLDEFDMGRWGGTAAIGGVEMKLLLVKNGLCRESREDAVRRRAARELEKIREEFGRLTAVPANSQAEAEKSLGKLQKKCRACVITGVTFSGAGKSQGRGRKASEAPENGAGGAVQITGKVEISEDRVQALIREEMMLVIGTTDVSRDWTMAELLLAYRRQQAPMERMWRVSKVHAPWISLDGFYFSSPRRVTALMWILAVTMLVFNATELVMRRSLERDDIRLPTPDGRTELKTRSLVRLKEYMENHNIVLFSRSGGASCSVIGLNDQLKRILASMGSPWSQYYQGEFYRDFMFPPR